MTFRPSKWVLYAPVAALPLLAALVVSVNSVHSDLQQRTQAALVAVGADWAKIEISGRDVLLTGDAPTDDLAAQVSQAVAGTYGVRLVRSATGLMPPLMAPTVNKTEGRAFGLTITGTWEEGVATTLTAKLGDKNWSLATDSALTSDGKGTWALKPGLSLAPGVYDLAVVESDKYGRKAADASTDEITVVPPPEMKPPTIESLESNSPTPAIHGTWPSKVATSLKVVVGAVAYELGTSAELTASGDDWTLVPAKPLPEGSIEVTAEVSDGERVVKSAAPGHVVIDTTPPSAPQINPVRIAGQPFTVTGTWAEGDAVSLVARLAGHTWTLGKDKAVTSDGKGNWSLTPDVTLAPGTYDLAIETTDKAGNLSADGTRDEIIVPEQPPPALKPPTVATYSAEGSPKAITGTWDEGQANALTVAIPGAGVMAVLGADQSLATDGNGNWTLKLTTDLAPGIYDVVVTSTAKDGRTTTDATTAEIYVKVPPPAPPPIKAPTVAAVESDGPVKQITGTWDEGNAETLTVAIPQAGVKAVLGADAALSSDNQGNWTLVLVPPLPPGVYDVVVTASAKDGRTASDTTTGEIVVKAMPPTPPAPALKVPTVASYAGEGSPKAIAGTWDEEQANSLTVAIPGAGVKAVLGTDAALSSDGKGNWTLTLAGELRPGIYDVVVTTSAKDGRTASDATTAELYVKAPPPVPPAPALKLPTVAHYSGIGSPKVITGTWDEGQATTLTVSIPSANRAVTLGADASLVTDGKGNWTWTLAKELGPGTYDVVVDCKAPDGREAKDTSANEIEVLAPPPPALKAPTVTSYTGNSSPKTVAGTWDEGAADALTVAIPAANVMAVLGADAALTSDGKGNWTLTLAKELAPGTYDVRVTSTAKDGRTASDASLGEIEVKAPTTPPEPAYDCAGVLDKISATFPILFAFNEVDLRSPYDLTVNQVAALLKDERCLDRKVEVTGYADYLGGKLVNRAISILRAQTVVDTLVADGVDAARLKVAGLGKSTFFDSGRGEAARSKNRRVVIAFVK